MKTSKRNRLLGLALAGSFSLFGANNALAAAGDDIANTATLSYTVGNAIQTPIDASVTFKEDRKVNFTVARIGTTSVGPGSTAQAVEFTITNNGNTAQNFLLRAEHLLGALDPFGSGAFDVFTPTTISAFVETNGTPGYQPGADTDIFVSDLAANGGVIPVYVVADMPTTQTGGGALVNNDLSVVSLVAQVALATTAIPGSGEIAGTGVAADAINNDDNGNVSPGGTFQVTSGSTTVALGTPVNIADTIAMETVYADPVGAGGSTSLARTGEHADASTYTMIVASLTVAKTSRAIYDDINTGENVAGANPKAIPGSVVRYTVQVDNAAGAGDATLTTISDAPPLTVDTQFGSGDATNAALPAAGTNNVRIVDGVGDTTYCTADGSAADGCTYDGTTLLVDLGIAASTAVLIAGQTLTIEFDVIMP